MQTRHLGTTELAITPLGFGSWAVGGGGWQFGWSISEVTLTFIISIFVLGIAAFFGGLWLNRKGPPADPRKIL
jgi:aryl-alcohol dehydrogenase-like predicted oxidoreductase